MCFCEFYLPGICHFRCTAFVFAQLCLENNLQVAPESTPPCPVCVGGRVLFQPQDQNCLNQLNAYLAGANHLNVELIRKKMTDKIAKKFNIEETLLAIPKSTSSSSSSSSLNNIVNELIEKEKENVKNFTNQFEVSIFNFITYN